MKRHYLILGFLCWCLLINAASSRDLRLTSGSTAFCKENATAILELDWSHATWEDYKPIKMYCGDDYEERLEISHIAFIHGFNSNSNGLRFINGENAKYKLIIRIDNFEQNQGSGWGRFYIRLYGTIEVIDLLSKQCVATFRINGFSGGPDYVQTDRFGKSFNALGKMLTKMKSKTK